MFLPRVLGETAGYFASAQAGAATLLNQFNITSTLVNISKNASNIEELYNQTRDIVATNPDLVIFRADETIACK